MGIPCTTGQVLEDESCSCGNWGACVWKYEICLQKHLKLLVWAAGSDTAEAHTRLTLISSTSYQTRRHIVSVEVIRVKKKKVCKWRNLVIFFRNVALTHEFTQLLQQNKPAGSWLCNTQVQVMRERSKW